MSARELACHADAVVRWLLEGERCRNCKPHPDFDGSICSRHQNGEGYTRAPVPHANVFRDIPEALAECVTRVARGEEPLLGVLGPWEPRGSGMWTREGTTRAPVPDYQRQRHDEVDAAAGWWLL